jgi:hypothetical protein
VAPSRDTVLSARGAFPRQVRSAPLARRRTPATVPWALPPPGRLLAPRRSLLSLGRGWARRAVRGLRPGAGQVRRSCRLLQSPRFSSTTADRPTTPRHARSRPLGVLRAAVRWGRQRARPAELSQGQGPPRTRTSPPAPPRAIARGRALPRSDRPGHLLSRVRACVGRRAGRRWQGRIPAKPPASDAKRRSHKGCCRSPSAKRGVSCAPEVPSIDGRPEADPVIHRLFPACGLREWCLYSHRLSPER